MRPRGRLLRREDSVPLLSKIILEEEDTSYDDSLPHSQTLTPDSSSEELVDDTVRAYMARTLQMHSFPDMRDVNSTSETLVNISHFFSVTSRREHLEADTSTLASMSDWTDGSALHDATGKNVSVYSNAAFDEASGIYSCGSNDGISLVDVSTIYSNYSEIAWREDAQHGRLGGNQETVSIVTTPPRAPKLAPYLRGETTRLPVSDAKESPRRKFRALLSRLFGRLFRRRAWSFMIPETSSSLAATTSSPQRRQWI